MPNNARRLLAGRRIKQNRIAFRPRTLTCMYCLAAFGFNGRSIAGLDKATPLAPPVTLALGIARCPVPASCAERVREGASLIGSSRVPVERCISILNLRRGWGFVMTNF
jgi:hypothetical protein